MPAPTISAELHSILILWQRKGTPTACVHWETHREQFQKRFPHLVNALVQQLEAEEYIDRKIEEILKVYEEQQHEEPESHVGD